MAPTHPRRLPLPLLLVLVIMLLASGSVVAASSATARDGVEAGGHPSNGIVDRRDRPAGATSVVPDDVTPRPGPRTVHGIDDRVYLSPANASIAFLELYDHSDQYVAMCTGTFIGPDTLLTAAHCLYDLELFGGFGGAIRVVPGKDGGYEPNGYDWVSWAWIPEAWATSGGEAIYYDYGLITLDSSNLGNAVGWYQIAALNDTSLNDPSFTPTIIGYPGDKPEGTQWGDLADAFAEVAPYTLSYDIDTAGGQSGSAVFRYDDAVIAGVHVRGGEFLNEATRIDQEVIDDFLAFCDDPQVGCSFDHFVEPPDVGPDVTAIDRTWERTDMPVADNVIARTWMWGPAHFASGFEPYDEAPGGERFVVYWDKSRMEITNPGGDSSSIWYVTNGLLALELMTGDLQLGDANFEPYDPAWVNVAGDADDPTGPTYATFGWLRSEPALAQGTPIVQRVDQQGNVWNDGGLAGYGATAAYRLTVPGLDHTVASPFWAFMNSWGVVWDDGYVNAPLFVDPFYATGFPVTEAYWADVKVGGSYRTVLIQCFERRCLTWTPSNPPEWQVEMGNVGQHYYIWRYGGMP